MYIFILLSVAFACEQPIECADLRSQLACSKAADCEWNRQSCAKRMQYTESNACYYKTGQLCEQAFPSCISLGGKCIPKYFLA